MSRCNVTDILAQGLQKYGELVVAGNTVESLLKKYSKIESVRVTDVTIEVLRKAIAACGNILEANDDEQFFIAVIPTGRMNATCALVAVVLQNDILYFAAFAKEGLIKQHLAQTAIDSIKNRLKLH